MHTFTQVRVLLPKQRILPPKWGLLLANPKLGLHQPKRELLQSKFLQPKKSKLLFSAGRI